MVDAGDVEQDTAVSSDVDEVDDMDAGFARPVASPGMLVWRSIS